MSAKEMFEKLGYRCLYLTGDNEICYMGKESKWYISFYLDDKVVQCSENDFYHTSISISVKELKAINKQIEELHWEE